MTAAPVSANLPPPEPNIASAVQETALSAVFRRLAGDAQAREEVAPIEAPQFLGFDDFVDTGAAPPTTAEPPAADREAAAAAPTEAAASEPRTPGGTISATEWQPEPKAEPEPELQPQAKPDGVEDGPAAEPGLVWARAFVDRLTRQLTHLQAKAAAQLGVASRAAPPDDPQAQPLPAPEREAMTAAAAAAAAAARSQAPVLDRAGQQQLPPNRRLHRRVKLGAEIEVDGVPCSLIDISVGGFAVTGLPAVAAEAVVPVTVRLTIDGIEVGTDVSARMVYANPARSSGRFIDLSASQTAFLRYLVTWRGEAAGAIGTTTLLDAINGAARTGEAGGDADKERWWAGLIGRKVAPPR